MPCCTTSTATSARPVAVNLAAMPDGTWCCLARMVHALASLTYPAQPWDDMDDAMHMASVEMLKGALIEGTTPHGEHAALMARMAAVLTQNS